MEDLKTMYRMPPEEQEVEGLFQHTGSPGFSHQHHMKSVLWNVIYDIGIWEAEARRSGVHVYS